MKIFRLFLLLACFSSFFISCDDDEVECANLALYRDADGDGLGDPNNRINACELVAGYVLNSDDDFDCDTYTLYRDMDGDGLGDPNASMVTCEETVDGYVANADDTNDSVHADEVYFQNHSNTAAYFTVDPAFSGINIYSILSSGDMLENSPEFMYGSMADGAGLLAEDDGTYTLINNIEADYSIARIKFDRSFKPVQGEYIFNAVASAWTAQCSGTLITPEEHGFGPLYLSGGEWGGSSKGVFATNPYRGTQLASDGVRLNALGEWSVENAVPIGKNAYADKTVVLIGDDQSNNSVPSGHLGMYVGGRGDLYSGKLHTLKVMNEEIEYEMDMEEGQTFDVEFIEMEERSVDLLDAEAKEKGAMGFSRVEDIDFRRGSAANEREIYFCVTGRKKPDLVGKGTLYGRVYKLVLSENDPTKGTLTCVLDGDKEGGKAFDFHSPDNILVTENYAYIQEDPNGYYGDYAQKDHYARVYQYDLSNGTLKTVLECDQQTALAAGVGRDGKVWEITGMIDISDVVNIDETFMMITQNHGWEPADGSAFTDPNANPLPSTRKEGSQLFVVSGLAR